MMIEIVEATAERAMELARTLPGDNALFCKSDHMARELARDQSFDGFGIWSAVAGRRFDNIVILWDFGDEYTDKVKNRIEELKCRLKTPDSKMYIVR